MENFQVQFHGNFIEQEALEQLIALPITRLFAACTIRLKIIYLHTEIDTAAQCFRWHRISVRTERKETVIPIHSI